MQQQALSSIAFEDISLGCRVKSMTSDRQGVISALRYKDRLPDKPRMNTIVITWGVNIPKTEIAHKDADFIFVVE